MNDEIFCPRPDVILRKEYFPGNIKENNFLKWYHRFLTILSRLLITKRNFIDYDGEFGIELQIVIPYAYFLQRRGLLQETISCLDTKCLYYFSENHCEKYKNRIPNNTFSKYRIPNNTVHTSQLNTAQWIAPPYKNIYSNSRFEWDREIVVIFNKYNIEWGGQPCNYLDINILESIVKLLSPRYQIIYNRPDNHHISDNGEILDLKEKKLLKRCNNLTLFDDLNEKNPDLTFNTLQMMILANCSKFISVQGGNAVLASYFGGENIIYTKRGRELWYGDYNHYPLYSGTRLYLCTDYNQLLERIRKVFL
ncbi:MAG: hypothetical protein MRK02_15210 [Candidatus Scalindua sp.]|nr:hypothetical protein [Candidatus Scalindua sp.]